MYEIQQGVQTAGTSSIWPEWIEYISSISHLLITINASSDVFIYFMKHKAQHYRYRYSETLPDTLAEEIV